MGKAGLVERVPDPGDRRVTLVALTALGADRYEEARVDHRAAVAERFLDRLEPADLDAIERSLGALMDAPGAEPPPR
jgi:DNA-binding MarR family transcriptional regulator